MSGFKDHFSGHAAAYARYRPGYPDELFDWLARSAPARRLAWDAGTGNGQAARGLACRFELVHATDASAEQIAAARPADKVHFAVEPAERCSLEDACADLVTVGQALHWFDLDGFYAEVRRVLRPGGMLAVWTYTLCHVSPAVDAVVWRLYDEVVGTYWPPERRHVEAAYADLDFPFAEVESPELTLEAAMDLPAYRSYLGTWSAARRYRAAQGSDPLQEVDEQLARAWGPDARRRTVRWRLPIRAGYAA